MVYFPSLSKFGSVSEYEKKRFWLSGHIYAELFMILQIHGLNHQLAFALSVATHINF